MKLLTVCLLTLLVLACAGRNTEQEEVAAVYAAYRTALLEQDGYAAWNLVDSHTKQYYEDMRVAALTLGREEIEGLDISSKIVVLRMRVEFDKTTLESMDAASLFAKGVERGWISKTGVDHRENPDRIEIEESGRYAGIYFLQESFEGYLRFIKERNGWKLALLYATESFNRSLMETANQAGVTDLQFVLDFLSAASAYRIDDRILDGPTDRGEDSPEHVSSKSLDWHELDEEDASIVMATFARRLVAATMSKPYDPDIDSLEQLTAGYSETKKAALESFTRTYIAYSMQAGRDIESSLLKAIEDGQPPSFTTSKELDEIVACFRSHPELHERAKFGIQGTKMMFEMYSDRGAKYADTLLFNMRVSHNQNRRVILSTYEELFGHPLDLGGEE